MQVLFVTSHEPTLRAEVDMTTAFAEHPSITVVEEDAFHRGDTVELQHYDAVVFFVKFRHLRLRESIDWRSFDGLRVLMDHDAFMEFVGWSGTAYRNEWTRHTPRLGFDMAVVSGSATAEHLAAQGLEVEVVHKGVDNARFHDDGDPRRGMAHFGTPYRSRAAMLRRMRRARVDVERLTVPYSQLNQMLNRFDSALVCNMGADVRYGKIGRGVERVRPGTVLELHRGPEPMLKNFEAAAAGCATFMDDVDDLAELGFIDGDTALIYRDLDELIERVQHYRDRPAELRAVGAAGAALCKARHGWDRRADGLVRLLSRRVR